MHNASSVDRRRNPRWSAAALGAVVALLGLLLAVLPAGGAAAHTDLVSTDPKDGSTVTSVPTEVSFTFAEDLLDEGAGITAKSLTSDQTFDLPPAEVDGDTVTTQWPVATPAGRYEVSYRVVGQDGHVLEGSIEFTLTIAEASPQVTVEAPDSTGSPASPDASSASASESPEAEDDGAGIIGWVIGFAIVVIIGGTSGMWIMRRANRM